MKYQDFIETIKEFVIQSLDDSKKVIIQQVLKNNDTLYDGLIIIDPLLNISPTIYLNPYFHRYLNGVPLEDICHDILSAYHDNLPKEDFDINLFKDFSRAKEHIIMKLVNYERNKGLLSHVPHVRFHDLAIIYVVAIRDFMDEFGTILIHNEHLGFWDISPEDLYPIAMQNTPRLLPYEVAPLEKILEHLITTPFSFPPNLKMSILTNQIRINGATCMLYPDLLKKIAEELDDDLIILPSSIHEVLLLPFHMVKDDYTIQELTDMVVEINETQLTDDEVLSDHAYLFVRKNGDLLY